MLTQLKFMKAFVHFTKRYDEQDEDKIITKRTISLLHQSSGGLLEDLGKELLVFLKTHQLNTNFSIAKLLSPFSKRADGIECLAALFVKKFKVGIGDLYIYPSDFDKNKSEESYFEYEIEETLDHNLVVYVYVFYNPHRSEVFSGTVSEYEKWLLYVERELKDYD